MKRFFIFPLNTETKGSPNPYIHRLADGISAHAHVVNQHVKHRGVLNLFLFLFRADVFLLNWVESFPAKRFGRVQSGVFIVFLALTRVFHKKVIWVLHNKGSHHGGSKFWTAKLFERLMHDADIILTHSNEGEEFVRDNYPLSLPKVRVFFHPVELPFQNLPSSAEKDFDLLIWGSLFPYKGVDVFLEFLKIRGISGLKVLIVGRCPDLTYKDKLLKLMNEDVELRDELVSLEDISRLASRSKYVLFTYRSETILSSGALMDTLRMNCRVLGPNYGSFRDLAFLGLITVYDDFEQVVSACESYLPLSFADAEEIGDFCAANTWSGFAHRIVDLA